MTGIERHFEEQRTARRKELMREISDLEYKINLRRQEISSLSPPQFGAYSVPAIFLLKDRLEPGMLIPTPKILTTPLIERKP